MSTETIASETAATDQLYAKRKKIYPQSVHGPFRRAKWIILCVTLGIYYLLPFVRWDRGPGAPSQAVLIDFPARRFYFFFIEIWPQEVYYLTGLLILAAMALFLMNAVAGRIWCGYLCPQTVWTDLFMAVERFAEGDRREHLQLDAAPWSADKIWRRVLKHGLWLMIAWWTGGAWVLYFADAPTLVAALATGTAPAVAYIWIAILTFTTYSLAGHMREQVCTYMCPWPRIQAALTDEHALNVTYRFDRGEPRASVKKAEALRRAGEPAGDCVDCLQCVHVCPTGVDIRLGSQLACIQCGLCIDACDNVMHKLGRPDRLIRYDSDASIKAHLAGQPMKIRIVRPRTILYAAIIVVVGAIMLWSLGTRRNAELNVLHDRSPVAVKLSSGAIRNAYTVHILNMERRERHFALTVEGLDGADVEVAGGTAEAGDNPTVTVGPDQVRELRLLVTRRPPVPAAKTTDITVRARDTESGTVFTATDHFKLPDGERDDHGPNRRDSHDRAH